MAREPRAEEVEAARIAYCAPVGRFEHLEFRMWRKGRPNPEGIRELHREWFEQGTPLIVELRRRSAGSEL